MFSLTKKKNSIDIELTGDVEVKTPSLPEYEEWCRKQELDQFKQQVYEFLLKITEYDRMMCNHYYGSTAHGIACSKIADYLVEKCK